jgi:hypothetical protein
VSGLVVSKSSVELEKPSQPDDPKRLPPLPKSPGCVRASVIRCLVLSRQRETRVCRLWAIDRQKDSFLHHAVDCLGENQLSTCCR